MENLSIINININRDNNNNEDSNNININNNGNINNNENNNNNGSGIKIQNTLNSSENSNISSPTLTVSSSNTSDIGSPPNIGNGAGISNRFNGSPNLMESQEKQFPNDIEKVKEMEIEGNNGDRLYDEDDDDNVGFKGWKTIRLIAERYLFGVVVAAVVGFFIVILSLPNWSDGTNYLNQKTYSIFFMISNLLFGPLYVVCGFIASYGLKRVKDSRIIMYGSSIAIAFILLFTLFIKYKVQFWFYYLDVVSVILCFVFGEVSFSYRVAQTIQKFEKNVVSKLKSAMTAYNYAAPDIIVTLFSLVYMFFLIPVYLSIDNSIFKLGWRLVIHPIYWTLIVMIARQFLDRDISTDDIMLNTNIVLHTFFHHQTLGKVFVFTFDDGSSTHLTYIGIVISALEDIALRSVALKRDEIFLTLLYGKTRAVQQVYSQESLQLRAAILNIQVALDFSGLITAPLFVYMFSKHKMVFHVLEGSAVVPLTLFIQSFVSIVLDLIVELTCTYIETKYYKLPIQNTWNWMKSHKSFLAWLVYGSLTMGLLAMIWLMIMVPRAGFCSNSDICSCGSIMANALPDWCTNSTMTM